MRRWIIDTDPGVDDAAAIIAAVRTGQMDIAGITTVHGNSPLEHTTGNALKLVELLGVDIPVYRGSERALLEPPRYAPEVHGKDGFGDLGLPRPARAAEKEHAVDFLLDQARRHPGQLSVLALGPLTNLAVALAKDRSLASQLAGIVLMGGTSAAQGNTTMAAEFNVCADPEAARMVFESGIPITMVPWETTLRCVLTGGPLERLRDADVPLAGVFWRASRIVARLIEKNLGIEGLVLCDLVAAAVIIEPAVVLRAMETFVAVETGGTVARGLTALDWPGRSGRAPNARVILEVDGERICGLFIEAITKEPRAFL
ncbi:MAG: nucleoside hydrolase [Bacillota bacterium]